MGVALDSSAVVAFLDVDDTLHGSADKAIRGYADQPLELSVVAYSELLVGVASGHHLRSALDSFIDGLQVTVVPLDLEAAKLAADLRTENTPLRLPDALILATASLSPTAEIFVTGDRRLAAAKAPAIKSLLLV